MLVARNAVALSFFLNGFGFASWMSRIPQTRFELTLSNSELGLLLLAGALGSVSTLPTAGSLINRWGAATVVRVAAVVGMVGMASAATAAGLLHSVAVASLGMFCYGVGIGAWDVAMNVEGAAVERLLRRTVMPRFHAGFSLGTVAGAGLGAVAAATDTGMTPHLVVVAAVVLAAVLASTGRFLTPEAERDPHRLSARSAAWRAWLEPRTLMVGGMVFALAVTEGTANDWLAVALIDGYGVERWVGVAGFGLFVTAMTAGRLWGPALLDRHGRQSVLWATMIAAAVGVLLIVYGSHPVAVVVGIVLWGVGASLGFPVGMSAAADDEVHAAARVSVVSTIAYTAFLAGPPLLGFLADEVGTLSALVAVALLLGPSALLVPAARELSGRPPAR